MQARRTDRRNMAAWLSGSHGEAVPPAIPLARKPPHRRLYLEPLEPRLLLSAVIDPAVQQTLLAGLDALGDLGDVLDQVGNLGQDLPIIDDSVGGLLDVGAQIDALLAQPAADNLPGASDGTTTVDSADFAAALTDTANPASAITVIDRTVGTAPSEILFDVTFSVVKTLQGGFNFGPGGDALGLSLDASTEIAVALDLSLTFGVDLTAGLDPADAFFIDPIAAGDLAANAHVSGSIDGATLNIGFLAAEVTGGTVGFDADLEATIADPKTAADDGRITRAEIDTILGDADPVGALGAVTGFTLTSPASQTLATLPFTITTPVPGLDFDATVARAVEVTGSPYGDADPDVAASPGDALDPFKPFTNSSADDALTLLRSLADTLGRIGAPAFDLPIPFTDGLSLSDALDITQALTDGLTDGLAMTSEVVGFLDGASADPDPGTGVATLTGDDLGPEFATGSLFDDTQVLEITIGDDVPVSLNVAPPAGGITTIGDLVAAFQDALENAGLDDRIDVSASGDALVLSTVGVAVGRTLAIRGNPETPTFHSVQELNARLREILGLDAAAADIIAFDQASDELTFDIALSQSLPVVDGVPIGFDLDLGDLANIASSTAVTITPSVDLSFTFGLSLTPLGDGSAVNGATPVSDLNGGNGIQLATTPDSDPDPADLLITLSDGTEITVNLPKDDPTLTVDGVVAAIQDAADAIAPGLLDAVFNADADALRIELTDLTGAGGALGSPSALGFASSQEAAPDADTDIATLVAESALLGTQVPKEAGFTLTIEGIDPVSVAIPADDARATGQDLVDAINARFDLTRVDASALGLAANVSLGSLVDAGIDASGRLTIDTAPAISRGASAASLSIAGDASGLFTVADLNDSQAALQLGILGPDADGDGRIEGAGLHGDSSADHFFIEDATLGGSIRLEANDIRASATLGFLGIEIGRPEAATTGSPADNAGVLDVDAEVALVAPGEGGDPPTTRFTLTELIDAARFGDSDIAGAVRFTGGLAGGETAAFTFSDVRITGGDLFDPSALPTPSIGIALADFADPASATVTTTGFEDFGDFRDLTMEGVLRALRAAIEVIDSTANVDLLNEQIPLIDRSVLDLIDIAEQFTAKIDALADDPAASVQALEEAIEDAFGLADNPDGSDSDSPLIDLSFADDVLLFDITFDFLPVDPIALPIDLDIQQLVDLMGGDPLLDGVTSLVSFGGTGTVIVEPDATLTLEFGIDFAAPAGPSEVSGATALDDLARPVSFAEGLDDLTITLRSGDVLSVNLDGAATVQDVVDAINGAAASASAALTATFNAAEQRFEFTDLSAGAPDTGSVSALGFAPGDSAAPDPASGIARLVGATVLTGGGFDPTQAASLELKVGDLDPILIEVPADAGRADAAAFVDAVNARLDLALVERADVGLPGLGRISLGALVDAGLDADGHLTFTTSEFALLARLDPAAISIGGATPAGAATFDIFRANGSGAAEALGILASDENGDGVILGAALEIDGTLTQAFISDTTGLELGLKAGIDRSLDFRSGIGPFTVNIVDGSLLLTDQASAAGAPPAGGAGPATFSVTLQDFAGLDGDSTDGRLDIEALLGLSSDGFKQLFGATLDAGLLVDLPISLPGVFDPASDVLSVTISDLDAVLESLIDPAVALPDGAIEISSPDFANLLSNATLADLLNNPQALIDGLDLFLGALQDILSGEVFGVELPLVGDKLGDGATFIADIRNTIIDPLSDLVGEDNPDTGAPYTTIDLFEKVITEELFVPLGIADVSTIEGRIEGGDTLLFDFIVTENREPAVAPIDFDIGIPGLGIEVDPGSTVTLDLDYTANLGFGYNSDGFFYRNAADTPEIGVDVGVAIPGLSAGAQLGFLLVDLVDRGSALDLSFDIDLFPDAGEAVPFSRLNDGRFAEFQIDGRQAEGKGGALLLDLTVAFPDAGSIVFPSMTASLVAGMDFLADPTDGFTSQMTALRFDDVTLDVGSFFSDFLGPIVDPISDVLGPVKDVLDILDTDIPFIGKSVLDFAAAAGLVSPAFIGAVNSTVDLANTIDAIEASGEPLTLNFGTFDLTGTDTRNEPLNQVDVDRAIDGGALSGGESTDKFASGDVRSAFNQTIDKSKGGWSIPLLTDAGTALKLLLGQTDDIDLVLFDLPAIDARFSNTMFFGIPGLPDAVRKLLSSALKLEISTGFNLKAGAVFGYDTFGLARFLDTGRVKDLADGFFVDDEISTRIGPDGVVQTIDEPILHLDGFVAAEIDFNLVGASGRLDGAFNLDLFDPNEDGKVRLGEITNFIENGQPECIFEFDGSLGGHLSVWWDFKVASGSYTFLDTNIIGPFAFSCPRDPILATELGGGDLRLNMGRFAAERVNVNTDDIAEDFRVESLGDGNDVRVTWTYDGVEYTQEFSDVTNVIGFGDLEDDSVDLSGLNDRITFTIEGGEGADALTGGAADGGVLRGDAGNDLLVAGAGAILIEGGAGADVIGGGDGDDRLFGFKQDQEEDASDGGDRITGGGGDDEIRGGAGDDDIDGGDGADMLFGGTGDDLLAGGAGDDRITGGAGDDTIDGDAGDDLAFGGAGGDDIDGGDGADILFGDLGEATPEAIASLQPTIGGNDRIEGGAGDDVLVGGSGADRLAGGAGDDILLGDHGRVTLDGAGAALRVESTNPLQGNDDVIEAGGGANAIIGGAGADTVTAGAGDDDIIGDIGVIAFADGTAEADDLLSTDGAIGGEDAIDAGSGANAIIGGAGADTITAGAGADVVLGDHGRIARDAARALERLSTAFETFGGDDAIATGAGDDDVIGGRGADAIATGAGDDAVVGDIGVISHDGASVDNHDLFALLPEIGGNDVIEAGDGDDAVIGGAGDDRIEGGAGADAVLGDHGRIARDASHRVARIATSLPAEGGDDTILGGAGDDILIGGVGDDRIEGGDGDDVILGDNGIVERAGPGGPFARITTGDPLQAGDDDISGGAGDDILIGGQGADRLAGGFGADTMIGDSGRVLFTALGAPAVIESIDPFQGGADVLDGGPGKDFLIGGFADDDFVGNSVDDLLAGDNAQVTLLDGRVVRVDTFIQGPNDLITNSVFTQLIGFRAVEAGLPRRGGGFGPGGATPGGGGGIFVPPGSGFAFFGPVTTDPLGAPYPVSLASERAFADVLGDPDDEETDEAIRFASTRTQLEDLLQLALAGWEEIAPEPAATPGPQADPNAAPEAQPAAPLLARAEPQARQAEDASDAEAATVWLLDEASGALVAAASEAAQAGAAADEAPAPLLDLAAPLSDGAEIIAFEARNTAPAEAAAEL